MVRNDSLPGQVANSYAQNYARTQHDNGSHFANAKSNNRDTGLQRSENCEHHGPAKPASRCERTASTNTVSICATWQYSAR
ncbi:hypothetical protein XpiCFBP4643_00295 [Xanthomonas pisi]|uniref:Uncharacterized protein n=1 Tax=Xanthomonas pisi TaxID=56457 RepID=A0A2S7D8H6_9XANT|nr:hypothetical protein XpiCFBP4643_00295 [Xanthomonas pisi]